MANCAIVGINWGDEGKGRMVDYLTNHFDVVVRYQGGGNAGHTVVNDRGTFALHLLPSGIFREGVVNILGNGVALDCENLLAEMNTLRAAGVSIAPENLKISDRASLLLPWHRELDGLEEARLADKKYGSTKQGIAPFYSDKYQKKTVMAGELLHPQHLKEHLADLLEWKNLTLQKVYGAKGYTLDELLAWVDKYCEAVKPYITNTTAFLRDAQKAGKSILFEAQLGALRDLDYGIYPYTTSSNSVAAYAPVGSGLPTAKLDEVVGVVKAYSSCVGEGPFVCEMFGEEGQKLRDAGAEYGAKTGRPRRVGPSRPTNSPSPSAFRTPSPSSSTWTAGSATSPRSAAGTSCRKTPGTTWSMWSGPSAVTSAMCPWARSGTASSSGKMKRNWNGAAVPVLLPGHFRCFSVE